MFYNSTFLLLVGMVGILMVLVFLLSRSSRDVDRGQGEQEEDTRPGESLTVDEDGVTGKEN